MKRSRRKPVSKTELIADPSPLRGKNLACWCRLDQPCHADVLLRLVALNPTQQSSEGITT